MKLVHIIAEVPDNFVGVQAVLVTSQTSLLHAEVKHVEVRKPEPPQKTLRVRLWPRPT